MAKLSGRELTPEAVALFLVDLSAYSEPQILTSLERCRKELNRFPTIAEVIARVPGEFPAAEEAWTLIPHSEEGSTIWTEEIATAYGDVRDLLERDEVAARMAFKEVYNRMVGEARAKGRRPKWMPSFGTDRSLRAHAVQTAIDKGRITIQDGQRLLPDPVTAPPARQLEGPKDLKPLTAEDSVKKIREIREKLTRGES